MTDKTEADTVADQIAVPFVRKPLSEQETSPVFPPYPGLPSETGMTTVIIVRRPTKATKPPVQRQEPQKESAEKEDKKTE